MLSCRQTLSTSWLSRYQKAGIPIVDYRDVTGSIHLKEGVVQILQVDSIKRLVIDQVDMVICDEIESIFAQLNSS
jgi:hypothetical protein